MRKMNVYEGKMRASTIILSVDVKDRFSSIHGILRKTCVRTFNKFVWWWKVYHGGMI